VGVGVGLIVRKRFSVVRAKLALEFSPFWVSPASKQDVCYDPLESFEKDFYLFCFYIFNSFKTHLISFEIFTIIPSVTIPLLNFEGSFHIRF